MLNRRLISNKITKFIAVSFAFILAVMPATTAAAESVIDPHEGAYGYYVDKFTTNSSSNTTPETNAAIGVLSGFADLWQPGETWSTGTILDAKTIKANIQKSYDIAGKRTLEQAQKAYEIEFNNLNWCVLDGLGEYKEQFIALSGIGDDPKTWKLSDKKANTLYYAASLSQKLRDSAASTSSAKSYYSFPRPYRWDLNSMTVITNGFVESQIAPGIADEKGIANISGSSDGGFPSGHTNGATLAAYGLAYAIPQKFQELIMEAAIVGNYRIIAGMHSPLDVMGGRIMATAITSANLSNSVSGLMIVAKAAYKKSQEALFKDIIPEIATLEDYEAYKKNLEQMIYYLTYDFEKVGEEGVAMRVPKGAEAFLATRLPYLTEEQRRYVLYTTGLESGYPLLDDAEGWGRLNYYKAAAGYAEFLTDVVVKMDATQGAYNACDSWLNDISGTGKLTLKGTGTLALVGQNTFTGGVSVEGGKLVMVSTKALGTGNVEVAGGTLTETIEGASSIAGNYTQNGGELLLTINSADDVLNIAGDATLGGTLVLQLGENFTLTDETVVLTAKSINGNFKNVKIVDKDSNYKAVVKDGQVTVVEAAPVSTFPTTIVIAAVALVVVAVVAVIVLKKKKAN